MTAVIYHDGRFPPGELNWPRLLPLIGPASAAIARYEGVLRGVPNLDVLLGPLTSDPGSKLRFAGDIAIKNPRAAAAVMLGRPDNGRMSWRISGTNTTYAAWQEEQIGKAAVDGGVGDGPDA